MFMSIWPYIMNAVAMFLVEKVCKGPDTRFNSWIQFIGSNSWIQLSAGDTRSKSLIQDCEHESSNLSSNWSQIRASLLPAWYRVVYCYEIGWKSEKRQTSLSFFRSLKFFSKDADTSCEEIRDLWSLWSMSHLAGKWANQMREALGGWGVNIVYCGYILRETK